MQLHVVDVVNLSFAHVLPQRTPRSAFFSFLQKGSREARKRERERERGDGLRIGIYGR